MSIPIYVAGAVVVGIFLYRFMYGTDTPHIKGLPEVPGLPVFGSLYELGTNHAKVAQGWAKKYGPVFQVRMGNRRIVFANSFESVRHLWITNQSALISRPMLHTFHKVVSSSQGFTIGTSPWDDSCKNRRKAAATALNRPAVQSYMPLIDLESTVSIKELLSDSKGGELDLDPRAYWQRYALNTSLTLNYGYRIDGNKDAPLLKEIVDVERGVGNFRSTSNNWQDYVPLLRLFPSQSNEAIKFKNRRDVYMDRLLKTLEEKIEKGTDKPCITGNIIKDPEAKLNRAEIKSICLTMVSAGLDTVPGNLIMGIAYLATAAGQKIQARAYSEIMKAYPDGDAWERCLHEEKIPYITALYKEILRYWTVIPICLPRVSIKPIEWNGVVIPPGTTFYMNAYAADYDGEHFKNPDTFDPERYLNVPDGAGTPHYGYGAGSRMCVGSHLANRELFTAFVRLISAFEFTPPKDPRDEAVMDCLDANDIPTSLTMEPKYFKVGFKPRNRKQLDQWIKESEERTNRAKGGYFASVQIGNPGQNITLQLDTGSSDVWVPWSEASICDNSGCSLGSYDPNSSSSFDDVASNMFSITYVDDSYAKGDYFTDDFTMGDTTVQNLTMGLAVRTTISYGLMGIGYAVNEASVDTTDSTYPNLPIAMYQAGHINSIAYSLWLNDLGANTGSILFGGVDTKKYTGTMATLNIQPDNGTYDHFTVLMTSLTATSSSGSDKLTSSFPLKVVLDSGTTLTYLPHNLATQVWDEVGAVYDSNYGLAVLPCSYAKHGGNFTFGFGGKSGPEIVVSMDELVVDLTNGHQPEFEDGQYNGELVCEFGIQNYSTESIYLLGATFLRSAYVVYDLVNNEIGIAQTDFNATESSIVAFESKGAAIPSAIAAPSQNQTLSTPTATSTSTGLKAADGFHKETDSAGMANEPSSVFMVVGFTMAFMLVGGGVFSSNLI